jgi:hypothetical protein
VIVDNAPFADGTFSTVVQFRRATYDGPTTVKGGGVVIDAPRSPVDLQNGIYSGHCKSLTAEGGVLQLHNYLGGVTSDGDVRLSPSVTVAYDVGAAMKMAGVLDLGGATLRIDGSSGISYGAVYKVVDNTSANPVSGTFANLPEGSTVDDRYKISYAGGDGNDVTLTDFGLFPSTVSLHVSPEYPQSGTPIDFIATVSGYGQTPTGTVTFSADTTVLGTAPVINGVAKLTAGALPRGHYALTVAYSGDSRIAPQTITSNFYVVAPALTLTSIDPPTVTAGVKTTLTLRGANFIDGSYVFIESGGYAATFVSPSELRLDFTPTAAESDYQLEVRVSQPDPYGAQESGRLKLNVTGVENPPSPFTFGNDLTTTVKGVTPGAMTFWLALARGGYSEYEINHIVSDTDHDGSVTLPFPFRVNALPPYGVWLVADLSAQTIVSDNPGHDGLPTPSPFPPKALLRDSEGKYTHVQVPLSGGYAPWRFVWARAGVGAWMIYLIDNGVGNGAEGRVTFETSAMKKTVGTSAPPPDDGVRPGDMLLALADLGTAWWGDAVDPHLSESDGPGKLGFAIASTDALENSGGATILLQRTEGSDGSATVQYATADGTAIAGRNYVAQAGTVTFGPGEVLKTITIPLADDRSYGGNAQFSVNLSNSAGAAIGLATHTVNITDDEHPPVFSLQLPASSVQEGDAGQIEIPITVKLTGATSLPVTVNWAFSEGQYGGAQTGELQFAPGETETTFTASYVANTTPEPDRLISVHLFNPTNATASTDALIMTIVDDDFASVSVADASVAENAGSVVVPLQLSRASTKPITVTYETRNRTALAGSDYTRTSGTVTVQPGSSIAIPILNDSTDETLELFEVVLTSIKGGTLNRSVAIINIVDDDEGGLPPPATPPRRRSVRH